MYTQILKFWRHASIRYRCFAFVNCKWLWFGASHTNFWFSLRPLLPKLIIYLVRMWWSKRKSNFFPSYAMLDWNIGVHLYQQSAVSFKLTKLNETNWFVPFKWAKRVRPTQHHIVMFLSKKINAHFNNWILMTFFWFGYVVIQPMHKNG